MWKPIVPVLAERFTANAPDLPGIGDSDTRKRCEASTRPQQNQFISFGRDPATPTSG
jgi:hypothetical protein